MLKKELLTLFAGGVVSKTIPFEAVTKKFNPFINSDKKIRVGWLYIYASASDTYLTDLNGVDVPAVLEIDVFVNDVAAATEPSFGGKSGPSFNYKIDLTETPANGSKKWSKIWINQTSRFIQFKIKNNQAGAKIQVHAMILGVQPVGRLV